MLLMEHGLPQALSEELQYYTLHNIWLILYELWKRRQSLYEATDDGQIPKHSRDEIRDTFSRLYNELKRRDKIEEDRKNKIEKGNKKTTAFENIRPISTLPPATLADTI